MRHLVRLCPVVLLAAAACGGGGDGGTPTAVVSTPSTPSTPVTPVTPTPTTSTSADIVVQNNSFSPGDVTVAVGSTVTWTWNACSDDGYGTSTCGSHSVTFDAGGQGSNTQSKGSYSRQFTAAGTYAYHCVVHGTAMSGTITVK